MRLSAVLLLSLTLLVTACTHNADNPNSPQSRTARAMEVARLQGPLAMHTFLLGMPKGADLHVHLSGAVYAETFLQDAAEDGLCIET